MTIKISFSDKTVRVAVEINGAIESKITELPQRPWVGLTDEELEQLSNKWRIIYGGHVGDFAHEIEAKLKEKNFD
jgi:hypothetical protein